MSDNEKIFFAKGNGDKDSNEVVQGIIKEMSEQTNNNILRLINMEVIVSLLLDMLMKTNVLDKDEFEKLLKEKSEKVQGEIEKQIQEHSGKMNL